MTSILIYWPSVLWFLGWIEFTIAVSFKEILPLGLSVWASCIILLVSVFVYRNQLLRSAHSLKKEISGSSLPFKILVGLCAGILLIACYESRHPPHLGQEIDALNYHMSLPRQHWIQGTWNHLSWSAADLWPMALQTGFAPAWFMAPTLHKIPQFIVTLWLFFLTIDLGRILIGKSERGWLPALAFFTTHGVMIQLGTAMMDLPVLYFLVAMIHATIHRRVLWAGLHLAVFATSKAFMPLQACGLALGMATYCIFFERAIWFKYQKTLVRIVGATTLMSLLFLARSAAVGWERAGTPLFPFAVCKVHASAECVGEAGDIIRESADRQVQYRNSNGLGRSAPAFLTHLWRVSVPTFGVNNEYDYPLGLSWLLTLVLFGISVKSWVKSRRVPLLIVLSAGFWATWWMGSQQSRWLYPVILLGWLGSTHALQRVSSKVLATCLSISAALTLMSEYRALKSTLFKSSRELQAAQETQLVWEKPGVLKSPWTLYAIEAIFDRVPGDRTWVLR